MVNKTILLIIILGSLMMAMPLVGKVGFDNQGNLVGISYSDDFMHVAFAREIANHFPPQHPLFAGDRLTNYHYGTDIIAAVLNRVSGISPVIIHFKIMPLVYAVLLGLSAWWLAKNLKMSGLATVIFLLFIYFGSSFSFVADLMVAKQLSWDDAFGIGQPSGYAANQPLLFSLGVWLAVLGLLVIWDKKPTWFKSIVLSVLVGSLMVVKVLAGMMVYVALLTALVFYLWRRQWLKMGKMLIVISVATVISIGIIRLVADDPGGFVWAPLVSIRRFIESPNFEEVSRDTVLKMYYYSETGNVLRITLLYFLAIVVFFLGNLGVRVMGLLFSFSGWWSKPREVISWVLLVSVVTAGVIPLFFLLKTGGLNSAQFYIYMLTLLNIPAAIGWARILTWQKRTMWSVMSGSLLGLFLLLGSVGSFVQAISGKPPRLEARVVKDLQDLGEILDKDSVILLGKEFVKEQENYFSALTGRRVYLEGVEYPRIQGHDTKERLRLLDIGLQQFYGGKSIETVRGSLGNESIDAVVISTNHILPEDSSYPPWRSNNLFQVYVFQED